MGNYGSVALRAVKSIQSKEQSSPLAAWERSAEAEYPTQIQSRKKGCPRGAFIGLCDANLIVGVEGFQSEKHSKNGDYAVRAARALSENSSLSQNKTALWLTACSDQPKTPNGQMDVALALYGAGMLKLK